VATQATPERTPLAARPILKWAGGKQALAARLIESFPARFDRYFEPFVGGASVFLSLQPARAVLCDRNAWLVDTYRAVRDHADDVARELGRLRNTRVEYLRIRALDPRGLPPARRAAQLVYLNKTCFRGLFRVNRAGAFNVPYGAYERRYFDPANLRRFAESLAGVELRCGDFEDGLAGITSDDFAYLDPPYHKLGGYSDFNRPAVRPGRPRAAGRHLPRARPPRRALGRHAERHRAGAPPVRRVPDRADRRAARDQPGLEPARRRGAADHERLSGQPARRTSAASTRVARQAGWSETRRATAARPTTPSSGAGSSTPMSNNRPETSRADATASRLPRAMPASTSRSA
jgi:DNA adenine methylase